MTTHYRVYDTAPDFRASTKSPHALALDQLDANHPVRLFIKRSEEIHADVERRIKAEHLINQEASEARTAAKGRLANLMADTRAVAAEALGRGNEEPDSIASAAIAEAKEAIAVADKAFNESNERVQALVAARDVQREILHGGAEILRAAYRPGEPAPAAPGVIGRLVGTHKTDIIALAPRLGLKKPKDGWLVLQQQSLSELADLRKQLALPVWPPRDEAMRSAMRRVDELAKSAAPSFSGGEITFPVERRPDIRGGGDIPGFINPVALAARYNREAFTTDVRKAIAEKYRTADRTKVVIASSADEVRMRKRDLQQKIAHTERVIAQATWFADGAGEQVEFPRGIPAHAWFGTVAA
ncbi:MAG: hypothetical protein KF861_02110 [Planctomycetaceae bacterium]|nr:hypothetical protein [Planctomycetaceae bacterium]